MTGAAIGPRAGGGPAADEPGPEGWPEEGLARDGAAGEGLAPDGSAGLGLPAGALRAQRRQLLKAMALPGRPLPSAAAVLPVPPGWGAGAVQASAVCLVPGDVLKVIDEGDDTAPGAVALRRLLAQATGVATTVEAADASLIQTRHRLPETSLGAGQLLVCQLSVADPLDAVGMPADGAPEALLRRLAARHGAAALARARPVRVDGRCLLSPGPLPPRDIARLSMSPATVLFAAGREGRIAALPPWTRVEPLDPGTGGAEVAPDDPAARACALCGSDDSHLVSLSGGALRVCSDTDWCAARRRDRHHRRGDAG